jgi:hypothetical protein
VQCPESGRLWDRNELADYRLYSPECGYKSNIALLAAPAIRFIEWFWSKTVIISA